MIIKININQKSNNIFRISIKRLPPKRLNHPMCFHLKGGDRRASKSLDVILFLSIARRRHMNNTRKLSYRPTHCTSLQLHTDNKTVTKFLCSCLIM